MTTYRWGTTTWLAVDEIDAGFRCYRLQERSAEEAMAGSLRRYGQLSPVVVCPLEGRLMLLDGFKRHAAAREVADMRTLWSRELAVDESTAKAAIYTLNSTSRQVQLLEEAWIVHALVRQDGLSQPAVASLLGRHKSWVCRRLALLEKLTPSAREDLGLGLLSPSAARQLTRLPTGNQDDVLSTARRESLTTGELQGVVDLLLAAGTAEKRRFVLEQPRQALREHDGAVPRSWDPRLSVAGNRVSGQLVRLLDLLGRMENWLRYSGRGVLELRDREPLRPGFTKLRQDAQHVTELTEDFLQELHLP